MAAIRAFWHNASLRPEPPIRSELFGVERLEQHAKSLAAAQQITAMRDAGQAIMPRLLDNTKVLTQTYRAVVKAVDERQPIMPAAEWLLNNFHVIDEQIRQIKRDLPLGYYRKLPKLATGPLQGFPRIFGVAWAMTAHTDSVIDMPKLTRFLQSYQQVQPLTIGELWATSITLRITLVENLRRLAEMIAAQLSAQQAANIIADGIIGTDEIEPEPRAITQQRLERAPWSDAFALQLSQRLRERDPDTTGALRWLSEKLAADGKNVNQVAQDEFQRHGSMNVSVRNVITSMRLVSTVDWAEFFEAVSPVDALLRGCSDFAAMDFATRDLYRRRIEALSRQSEYGEMEIATKLAEAMAHVSVTADPQKKDPGYFLLAQGKRRFEKSVGAKVPLRLAFSRAISNAGISGYVGVVAAMTLLLLAAALIAVSHANAALWQLILLAIAGVVPASEVAVALSNRLATELVGATRLPALALRDGVPDDLRTIVVVPTLLTSVAAIREQIERLEVHYLANADDNLTFALLSDWRDEASEQAADDALLLQEAASGIAQLNARYGQAGQGPRFHLLHRRRLWNDSEGKWMGWERKRGKLHELNRLLRGAQDTSFIAVEGTVPQLPDGIRYVITLDADTRMPMGAAKRLIGKMAHPLNRPRFDPVRNVVVAGHAIMQPRVTPSLPENGEGSLFQQVFSGPNGIDPYAFAISDVYQDLYGEGSYVGKGIYEVDAFERVLRDRIPPNTVLSHDLLEGICARAALVTDIEVIEEFPDRYEVEAARQHRWARGDWQMLPWIFGSGRRGADGSYPKPLAALGSWKLFDNLRRSLSAPTTLLALLLGWLLPVKGAALWTAFVALTIILPPFLPVIIGFVPRRAGSSLRNHFRGLARDAKLGFLQTFFQTAFLAHRAWLMLDAVVRTLYRLSVHRRLLEWVTAQQASGDSAFRRSTLIAQIAAGVGFAGVAGAIVILSGHMTWPLAVPFCLLWAASPLLAFGVGVAQPPSRRMALSAPDALALRLVARRTWRFFERFVAAEDNMLPPDNFQEEPNPVIAHRTSPTNMGLYLISIVAARDFGWIGTLASVERLEESLAAMDKLQRFRGHFYNWYDTSNLRTLEPRYVSTVDSGNLAGYLIALAHACREMVASPIVNPQWTVGLRDHLALLQEAIAVPSGAVATSQRPALQDAIAAFSATLGQPSTNPTETAALLGELTLQAVSITRLAEGQGDEVTIWAEALKNAVGLHHHDLARLVPWTSVGQSAVATMPTLAELPSLCDGVLESLTEAVDSDAKLLREAFEASQSAATILAHRLNTLADRAQAMAMAMEFGFLFDADRQLLSIGYRDADGSLDTSFYDLLASEARLASFFAIAKGDVAAKHWFRLGRTMAPISTGSVLISWSGSMFEYLMPSLVMRGPAGSLLEETNRLVVWRQKKYGDALRVPWGISESEFNARDIEQNYQYSSFGIPDLGYKRGLSENLVIAPYATGLAAMFDPSAAAANYRGLTKLGARGPYGWCEAIDFTPTRLPEGKKFAVVRAYMAHHQAMTIVAIANVLLDGAMRRRFHAEAIVQAAELLLQERVPRDIAIARPVLEQSERTAEIVSQVPTIQRRYTSPHSRFPRTHVLSNGRYAVMVTAVGSGYTRWGDTAITRWREDVTCDGWGSYIFLRDVRSGFSWSTGYQPSAVEPDSYEAVFSEERAEILRQDGAISTKLEILVSPESDAEVRRITITNHGTRTREIELTSYAELVLARQSDDVAHPAFGKLFVETSFEPGLGAILATRRRRSDNDPKVWAAHLAVVESDEAGDVQFETDRARFIGRGQSIRRAAAIVDGWPLSNTVGAVLDPIFSLRRRLRIARGATVRVAFWTMVASTREEVLYLADKHRDSKAFERAATLAWTQAQMQLRHLGVSTDEAHLFQRLANHILYADAMLRPSSDAIKRGLRQASILWGQGISGDLPILLVRINDSSGLDLVRQLLRAREYWRVKQIAVDLVILNEQVTSYVQGLQADIETVVRSGQSIPRIAGDDVRGAVFVLRADQLFAELRAALPACARVVLRADRGSLAEQLQLVRNAQAAIAPPPRRAALAAPAEAPPPRPELEYFNGLGGFAQDGREYVTVLSGGVHTPVPWINVIANPSCGFQVSTDGAGFTWALNSQQNQLTPWSNDAVCDTPGEVIYLRDEDSGELWCATALPIVAKETTYVVHHGQGYSRFACTSHGISLELTQFVPLNDPIKISRLKIVNHSGRPRRLSVTTYAEWALGPNRAATSPFIVTEIHPATGALFARNPWSEQFGAHVAFADLKGRQTAWTADRAEFVGRDGSLDNPLALRLGGALSMQVGAGLDPCAALQAKFRLSAVGETEVVGFLGQAPTAAEAEALLVKYRAADLDAVLREVTDYWDVTLEAVQIKTPDRSLDILVNRWLLYQTLVCRVWARAGFYQASGAYGFRDQLQDVMALCISRPELAREHLLRAAGRQFAEGDVQHWWLPETGRGIRTRVSDDRVWLAYAVMHYVRVTGDAAVLDESVPFLEGQVLKPGERDAFFQPEHSEKSASLFDHCALALDSSLANGPHGLPLMGIGDWNDGMDRVGGEKGESVWLGWFLYTGLSTFAPLAERRGRREEAAKWRQHAAALQKSLEAEAWDGDWYRRAYFDDGTPLGSVSNAECRIDSIAQSWAVISGAADSVRATRAMAAVDKYLVRRDERLVQLFTPPFENPERDPGYIKGYPPGIRENGGQYTHAAIWSAWAYALLGDGDKAHEVLSMLNPITHTGAGAELHRYRVEPYVVCADVYSMPPHVGRGGWTWYTGSAGWMYRVALEGLLGLHLEGNTLRLDPAIPKSWPQFEIRLRHRSATYEILVENPLGVSRGILAVKLDGAMVSGERKAEITLQDDGATHQLHVILG
ncbi:MAG: glucoamylase family protein [Rhizomicrobium sp.]|nr:glucoamylase family protein [Rhizomicrobium sp.]